MVVKVSSTLSEIVIGFQQERFFHSPVGMSLVLVSVWDSWVSLVVHIIKNRIYIWFLTLTRLTVPIN